MRGVAVGIATGLMGLALMTQSRGAAWSLGISLVVLFAISPGRVRLLFYLVVPALLMVYAFPTLNQYWTHGPAGLTGGVAARTLTVAVLAGGFMGMIVALLEKWVKVSGRMKAIFGAVVLAGCAAGLVYGSLTLTQDVGGPLNWFERTWQALVDEPAIDSAAGAGLTPDGAPLSNPTRADMWEAAWQRLQSEFLLGTGADNSAFPGASGSVGGVSPVAQADSLVLQTIGETGVIGGVLLFGGMLLSVIGIMWPRTGAGWRSLRKADRVNGGSARASVSRWGRDPLACGWEMALLAAVVYWFVHANMERLWLMTGVTLPALLMLAAALAATDARARTMWPRLSRRLRRGPVGGKRSSPEAEADARAETDAGAREASPPRAAAARSRARTRLQPEGPLSDGFRIGLMVLSAATVILAVPAYLFELL